MNTDLKIIKKAIARVSVDASADNPSYGTAFYVGDKFVISALHVVADLNVDRPDFFEGDIKLDFAELAHSTKATVADWDVGNDWVVLECIEPPQATPIECGAVPNANQSWESFGYPEFRGADSPGMKIDGDVTDPEAKSEEGAVVLQLYCKQAAAGAGTRLHGFSGAPCLIDGKAVGILRFTLLEELADGRLKPQLFTKAGTVFACRSREIVGRKREERDVALPNDWSPPAGAEDFLVILSQEEKTAKPTLRSVATSTHEFVKDRVSKPYFIWADEMVSCEERLEEAVRMLCRASVVVFDATEFEPAVMLLMGIRALVRRGVTILSVGGNYALGKALDVPFNITDANVVAHSMEQNRRKLTAVQLLRARLRRGLSEIDSPYYLDLPVFDAIRRLPEERRGIRARDEGVLVLCSFDQEYTEHNWEDSMRLGLQNQLDRVRGDKPQESEHLGVARSFELNSPRLVTQAVYEEIRRTQACIVDLTGWSPSVLFELGVRLAASAYPTVCMIERNSLYPAHKENWNAQCAKLVKLLVGEDATYRYDIEKSYEENEAYRNAYGPNSRLPNGPTSGSLHKLVERELSVDTEPASRSVYRELLDSAKLFARVPGSGGKTKPVGLFPGNVELVRREEDAEFERLLATWYYLSMRYDREQILQNAEIRAAINDVIAALLARHLEDGTGKLDKLPDLKEEIVMMRQTIKAWEKQNA